MSVDTTVPETASPITAALREHFNVPVNRNGQIMGNVAFPLGQDVRGRALHAIHMYCTFCGYKYQIPARLAGRINCPRCGESETTFRVPEHVSITPSEIRPVTIDRDEFYEVKEQLVVAQRARKLAAQANGGAKETPPPVTRTPFIPSEPDLVDRIQNAEETRAALLADDGRMRERVYDVEGIAEKMRTQYLDAYGEPYRVWEETHEAVRAVWLDLAKLALTEAGLTVMRDTV